MPHTWSAPVRYAEVDQQGVVFNAHYLLYCDEAMGAFCLARGLRDFVQRVQLVSSAIAWSGSARWGDTVDVDVACTRVGTTSATLAFTISVDGTRICAVETIYVLVGEHGPEKIDEPTRAALTS